MHSQPVRAVRDSQNPMRVDSSSSLDFKLKEMYVCEFSDLYIGEFSQESTNVAFLYYQLSLPNEFLICAPKHQNARASEKTTVNTLFAR